MALFSLLPQAAILLALAPLQAPYERGDVRVTVESGEREITVDQDFAVKISVSVPRLSDEMIRRAAKIRSIEAILPGRSLNLGTNLLVKDVRTETVMSGDRVIDRWMYMIEPQLPGEYLFPSLEIKCQPVGPGAEPLVLKTEPFELIVRAMVPDPASAEVRPGAPPVRQSPLKWVILAILTAAFLGRVGLRVFRFYQRRQAGKEEPENPASGFRVRLLERLDQAQSPAEVAEVLDDFLRQRWGVHGGALSEAEIQSMDSLPVRTREELAEIRRDLDSGLYGPENAPLKPELKNRVEQVIRIELPS